MTTSEIILEVKNIQADLLESKLTFNEAIDGLNRLSEAIDVDFSLLYNAFYSSNPELYIN
jgi:hypothetical protein